MANESQVSWIREHPNTAQLVEEMNDVPNRVYRYRVARWMLPLVMRTPLTPNQITVIHALVGITAGYFIARGTYQDFVIAFVLAELRMIFDCLDGVVARAKKLYSPLGRSVDEMGDMIGWLGIQGGAFYYLRTRHPEEHVLLSVGALLAPAIMAVVYDYYKRKFASALTTASNGPADELVRKCVNYARDGGGVVARFGLFFDWLQLFLLAPRTRRNVLARVNKELGKPYDEADLTAGADEIAGIRAQASSPQFRATLKFLSWITGDNAITLMNFGLLTGAIATTQKAVMIFGYGIMVFGAFACQRIIRTGIRINAEQKLG
jgi:phosphatidylglycerophosphate synthase